jgi:pimeloyl-ACP methyl ester carboxylesterase
MKTKNISIIIISLFLFFGIKKVNGQEAPTEVYLVHGMEGAFSSLSRFYHYYNTPGNLKNMNVIEVEYSSRNGIKSSAEDLDIRLRFSKPNAFIIAHSMGGVNARRLWVDSKKKGEQRFGRLITLSSPHKGALICNKILDGSLSTFLRESYLKATAGPATEPLLATIIFPTPMLLDFKYYFFENDEVPKIFNFFIGKFVYKTINALIQTFFGKRTNDFITDQGIQFTGSEKTAQDLAEGSDALKELENLEKQYPLDIPKIAIYGDEDDPSVLRLISSSLYSDKLNKENIQQLQENPDDEKVVNWFNNITGICSSQQRYCQIMKFGGLLSYALYSYKEARWKESADFFNNDFNEGASKLLGLYRTERFSTEYCPPIPPNKKLPAMKSATVGTNCTIQYYYKLVKQPNDGLLNKDVQTAIPGIKNEYIIKAEKINHEQMKHHKDVAKILDDIFNGGKGDKFYIK